MTILQRILRGIFGVFAGATFICIGGCRHEVKPITIVSLSPPIGVFPVLRIGQVIKWKSPEGAPEFVIAWKNKKTPCKEGFSIKSTMIGSSQTAICTVIALPPAGIPYQYGVQPVVVGPPDPNVHILNNDDGVVPCPGCYYMNEGDFSSNVRTQDVHLPPAASIPQLIFVQCNGVGNAQLYPQTVALKNISQIVNWEEFAGTTQTPIFTPAQVSCSSATAPYSCDFSRVISFPVKYTMKVASSCPNDGAPVTLNGEIDAPSR